MMDRLVGGMAGLGAHILRAPRLKVTLVLAGYGAFLVGLSWLLDLHDVTVPHTKHHVGFVTAPNWTLTGLLLWPAMFFMLRSIIDSADQAFADIDASPMTWLRGDSDEQRISATWQASNRLLYAAGVAALVLAIGFSVGEWWSHSGTYYWNGRIVTEADWSNVAPGGGPRPGLAQASFALLAFLYQAVAIALMATFALMTILIARTVGLHGSGEAKPPLLIDIESNDPAKRVGFERFTIVIDHMIAFVGLAFANFFLTRIQNAYLRSDVPTLWEFLRQDLGISPTENLTTLFDSQLTDFSSLIVAIAAVIALFQCFFFFNATLRHAATLARNRSDRELIRGALATKACETGLDRAAVRERLQTANVWPLGYSDLLPTLSFLTICVSTIVFYRIGIYLVFIWIAGWILSRTAAGLLRR